MALCTPNLCEASPLNRVIKQFGPGSAWRSPTERPQTMHYGAATATVYRFHVTDSQINVLVPGTTNTDSYNAKDLSLKTTTDEQGNATTDYTDLLGRLVRRDVVVSGSETLTTVYIYDDLGRLAGVLPPKLTAYFQTTAAYLDFTNAVFDELAFVYQYDGRGRMIRKHIPSAGWTELVYDTSDRLVMSQDEQDRAEGKWRFTRYDGLNRPVQSGRMSLTRSAADLRNDFAIHSRQTFPATITPGDNDLLTQSYYDSYADVGLTFNPTGAFTTPFPNATNPSVRGLPTGGQVRNLENGAWYNVGMWYDERGRLIQQQSQNHLGGTDRTDTQYRFNGEVLAVTLRHERTMNGQPVLTTVATTTEYDHASRPVRLTHAIDGAAPTELARYTYDAIGRLVEKNTGGNSSGGGPANSQQSGVWTQPGTWQGGSLPTSGADVSINSDHTVSIPATTRVGAGPLRIGGRLVFGPGSTLRLGPGGGGARVGPLQTITYKYHIRGGLLGINLDGNGNPGLSGGSLFALRLGREEIGQFGGNISFQTWATARDGQSRQYTYHYDGADRLTGADYGGGNAGEDFSLSAMSYDKNGNLLSLTRNGLKSDGSFGQVDNLAYTYTDNGNKVRAVSDQSGEPASFTDVAGADDYSYYVDGSLKSDANKGITLIEYNHLKLPRKITLTGNRWVAYEYDATGKKLRKTTSAGEVTDYVGVFEYLNGQLSQISHEEGRAIPDGAGGYEYEYRYEDHLGNLRALYRDSAGVAVLSQVEQLGPWGEVLGGIGYHRATKDRYGFGGHERQEDFGLGVYDFGARMYDPVVPRFWQIDPLAENSRRWSPFVYGYQNPVRFTDPDGMAATECCGPILSPLLFLQQVSDYVSQANSRANHTLYLQEKLSGQEPSGLEKVQAYSAAYLKGGIGNYSDANDAAVLTRGTNLDGTQADIGDKTAAGAAMLLPMVGGKFLKDLAIKSGEGLEYVLRNSDIDLRSSGVKFNQALDAAFNATGVSRDDFDVTKWGKNQYGKSVPVEYRASGGAEVSIDYAHTNNGRSPDAPHIGWQTRGKGQNQTLGHIILDNVPAGRSSNKLNRGQY